ncbi:hypothetical protein [Winogradskyella sediminis]|uniref:hypothetical protein n=1 Tax=Winogradskyella sediminis TaxID=1382466 RepID=UPI003AA9769E
MNYTNNISTNILRDQSVKIDYLATPNAKEIFDRMFLHNYGANKSFNLIGNYGTGKSTFLWALEKNLKKEEPFFTNIQGSKNIIDFDFIKIIGSNTSLTSILSNELKLKGNVDSELIIKALEKRRKSSKTKGKGLIIIIDEFGKLLEYASSNNSTDDIYLLQQISEWTNNDKNDTYFIITLHQNFSSYGKNLSSQDKLEWEKVKGRFVDLVFNEPVEQLIYFASKKLKEFRIPKSLNSRHGELISLVDKSKLVNLKTSVSEDLTDALYPLDWLSANVLVNSLQRYGQNERSLFSFLNDSTKFAINGFNEEFYTVSNVYDYLVNSLPSEINSFDNPHRAQWLTTFRVLEKAELIFNDNYEIVSEVIKTISLVNIFSKIGGLFNETFIVNYFSLTRETDVSKILDKLQKSGIIRFYKHSNKINFLEGTDIDLEQELITVNKEINSKFSLSNEILNRIDFPVLLAKRHSFLTGTNRFFEFKILDSIDDISSSAGEIDGYINLIFDNINLTNLKKKSKIYEDNLFVIYENSSQIRDEILTILKFEKLLEKHQLDTNALKLLRDEKKYYVGRLTNLILDQLFGSNENIWLYKGKTEEILSRHNLYGRLSQICDEIYSETPIFINELINKEFISTPINTARKALFRKLLDSEEFENLGFEENKFPPEKAIYISLLKETGIHQKNENLGYFQLDEPNEDSELYNLWHKSEAFLTSSISNKRNLKEFYEELLKKPYKLKKGFIDYWIPIFLIAKKEDYALFHVEGGFIPFLKEDTIDLIHKKPQDFLIKSYDVSGLKLNLLESYKELVQLGNSEVGKKSTFLSIFGNFLRFQRALNNYTLKTKKLTPNAIKLREAIVSSKDPEDALFNLFPSALGYHSLSIKEDEEVLSSFTNQIQDAIREIRTVYDELLDRIENVIIEAFHCEAEDFDGYKNEIREKMEELNLAVLSQKQNIFYKRLISPLDDRTSWIKSVADVALGKGIDDMLDEEEPILIDNIKDLSLGLIKATEIQKYNSSSTNGKLYSIRFFEATGGFKDERVFLASNEENTFKDAKEKIRTTIKDLDKDKRKELLIELLSKEMSI